MQKSTTKNIILGLVVLALAAVLIWAVAGRGGNTGSKLLLYTREDCPHCKIVKQFITDNKIADKFNIEEKEVKYSVKNSNELMVKAANCGLDLNNVGVPMLYDNGVCYTGDQDIINFFNSKL
ncbi:MAG: hypothetical protein PHD72_03585 [Patescibacteria group bacterium]|nr:hypothetical protein [Patescibacteria group bacterium]